MHLKRFSTIVLVRVALLLATMVGFAAIFGRSELFFNQVILSILIALQVVELIRHVRRTNRDLAKFLLAIKNADFTVHFGREPDRSFQSLHAALREILDTYGQMSAEREVQYQYLQLLVSHIDVGIISLRGEDEIALMNQAALDLLQIDTYHYWHNVQKQHPTLVREVASLQEGESKRVELKVGDTTRRLSVQLRSAILLQQPYRIITLQDIEEEINQSEVEAYHRLIRILTHEIMNSITPIASLSETLLMMLKDAHGDLKTRETIEETYLPDLAYSLQTISKRSDGLLHFVEDYRKLTKLPQPQPETIGVAELLQGIGRLMQAEFQAHNIRLRVEVEPKTSTVWGDRRLIEQVLINLVTNSVHALTEVASPQIMLRSYLDHDQPVIEVRDNGRGIEPDKLDQIFVPFFSTKEQGAGVGLSLSRHIMTLHRGSLKVQSQPGQTSFFLYFRTRASAVPTLTTTEAQRRDSASSAT